VFVLEERTMGKTRILSREGRIFQDRREAGRIFVRSPEGIREKEAVVLGIPRGGVVVAAQIAQALEADLDVALTRKIGAPLQPELAIGALAENGQVYLNELLAAQ
jgi:putative phosphoribosyl transferase